MKKIIKKIKNLCLSIALKKSDHLTLKDQIEKIFQDTENSTWEINKGRHQASNNIVLKLKPIKSPCVLDDASRLPSGIFVVITFSSDVKIQIIREDINHKQCTCLTLELNLDIVCNYPDCLPKYIHSIFEAAIEFSEEQW
jgi:hypothetical protein